MGTVPILRGTEPHLLPMLVPFLSRTGAEMAQEIAIETKGNPLTTNILGEKIGIEKRREKCFLSLQILYSKGNILILYPNSDKPLHRATRRYTDATRIRGVK